MKFVRNEEVCSRIFGSAKVFRLGTVICQKKKKIPGIVLKIFIKTFLHSLMVQARA